MVSPGVVPADVLSGLSEAGVSWYACYQETHNRELFKRLRPDQNYTARMENKELAGQLGLLTEEGLLCGVGETPQDIADSIRADAGNKGHRQGHEPFPHEWFEKHWRVPFHKHVSIRKWKIPVSSKARARLTPQA